MPQKIIKRDMKKASHYANFKEVIKAAIDIEDELPQGNISNEPKDSDDSRNKERSSRNSKRDK